MSTGGGADHDLFRIWLEGQRAFLGAGPAVGATWERAQALHRSWTHFLSQIWDAQIEGLSGLDPFDPAGWMRPEGAGGMADLMRWLEGPELADLWPEERRAIRSGREWLAWVTAMEQMRAICGQAWLAAFRRFATEMTALYDARKTEGAPPPRLAEIQRLWSAIAEAEMLETYRSPAWLKAQRDLLRAGTDLRAGARARVEQVSTLLGLPTRAEVDDLHRSLHDMQRELRRLRRARGVAS